MAAPMRSTDFRSIVEPILNECFDGVYDQRADEWSRVFREEDGIPRNYHEEPVLYGFGAAPQLPDGTPVTYQQGGVLFLQRYVYNVYGLAFALTKVLIGVGKKGAVSFGYVDGDTCTAGRECTSRVVAEVVGTHQRNGRRGE